MVLMKLVMCGFGSYADENVIDFSKKQEGVFLITGDTGSGKTTIFDAITFALYGKTSGDKRDGAMMRSQFARKDQPSYVEFTFRIKRDVYVIRRNPAYQIETHYKNGKVKMVGKDEAVTLFENGEEFVTTRKTEVNKRIQEIIKVDFEQFTQIAMIAQGEFMKLLTAETKRKKEIFSKLFHTNIYQNIAKELEQKCSACYKELKDEELLCRHQINQIVLADDDKRSEWDILKELPLSRGQEILDFVQEQICYQRNVLEVEKHNLEDLLEHQRRNQEEITSGESLLELFSTREQLLNQGREFCENAEELPKVLESLSQQEGLLQPEFHRVSQAVKVFEQLSSAEELLREHERKLEECQVRMQENFALITQLTEKKELLEKQISDAGDPEKGLLIVSHELDKLIQKKESLIQLKANFDVYNREDEAYKLSVAKTEEERQLRNKLQLWAQDVEDRYYLAQAGILAQHLSEGSPCPVCGSTEHPQKASLNIDAPDKAQMELAKKNVRKQEEKLQKQMVSEGALKEKVIQLAGQIEEKYAETFEHPLSITEVKEEHLCDSIASVKLLCKKKEVEMQDLQGMKLQISKWKKQIDQTQEKIEACKHLEEELSRARELCQMSVAKSQEACQQLKTQTLEVTREDAVNKCDELKAQIKKIQNQRANVGELIAQIQLITQQISEREKPDLTEAYQWREESKEKRVQFEKSVQRMLLIVNGNTQCYEFLAEHFSQVRVLAEQYQTLLTLHETANGRVSGKIKIDFETYVQRQYLKKILHAANRRLYEMSMGQFILKMKELSDAGKVGNEGLDLYVHSLVTNSDRDVKTLSGGESFIAALSMALGLSDVVTRTVGSIKLNLMFIDEGFGSLDDASRNQAIKILNSLAGTKTLVGIISHVSELKEQIDEKLIVTKGERGSSVKWEKF